MAGFKFLSLLAPLLISGVFGQSTTDANPAILITSVLQTSVMVVPIPYTTVIDGMTTVATTLVPTTAPGEISSIIESLSSGLESASSVVESLSSEASAAISGTTLITSTIEGLTTTGTESLYVVSSGTTIVSGDSTSIIPDVTISTITTDYTSVISNGTTTTFTSTTGAAGTGGTTTESGGSTTSTPAAAANVKVQMGGLLAAFLLVIGLL